MRKTLANLIRRKGDELLHRSKLKSVNAYRTASGRFKVLVESVAKQAQKQEQQFQRFRFHDLRHRHAVDWLKSGRSIYDLQQRLGHTSVKTTEIYLAFLTPEEKRHAMFSTKQKQEQIQEHEQRSEIFKSGSTN